MTQVATTKFFYIAIQKLSNKAKDDFEIKIIIKLSEIFKPKNWENTNLLVMIKVDIIIFQYEYFFRDTILDLTTM